MSTLLLPTSLGRYELRAEVGRVGAARLFQAEDPRHGQTVYLKLFDKEVATPSFLARLKREATTLRQINYHALATVYNAGMSDGHPYLVMAPQLGHTLAGKIAIGDIPPTQAVQIVGRLAEAVSVLHEQGVVHGDIHPRIIYLNQREDAILAGYCATQCNQPNYRDNHHAGEPCIANDVYALGVLLLHTLTGDPELTKQNVTKLPQLYRRVIGYAVTSERQQRFPSVEAFSDALIEAIAQNSLQQWQAPVTASLPAATQAETRLAEPQRMSGPLARRRD